MRRNGKNVFRKCFYRYISYYEKSRNEKSRNQNENSDKGSWQFEGVRSCKSTFLYETDANGGINLMIYRLRFVDFY
jgi:hypothetical protein